MEALKSGLTQATAEGGLGVGSAPVSPQFAGLWGAWPMAWRDLVALCITFLGAASSFALLPLLHKGFGIPHKFARKVTHMAGAHMALFAFFMTGHGVVAAAPWITFASLSALSLTIPGLPGLQMLADALRKNRGGDGWTPVAYFSALAAISYFVPTHPEGAAICLGSLAWGDGLAGMTPYEGRKRQIAFHSWVMFAVTSVWTLVIRRISLPPTIPFASGPVFLHSIAVGAAATAAEWLTGFALPEFTGLPTASWENAAIPAAAGAAHWAMRQLGT